MKKLRGVINIATRVCVALALLLTALAALPVTTARAESGGYTLDFDGVNDAVRVGNVDNLGPTILGATCRTTKSMTVWFRPLGAAQPDDSGFGVRGDLIMGDTPEWFGITRATVSGVDRIRFFNFDNNADIIATTYTVGEWVHLAYVHANGRLKAYKNGVLVGDIASGETTNNAIPLPVGCANLAVGGQYRGPQPFPRVEGQIDEAAFWGKELTVAEIRQLMYAGLVGDEANLGAYYKMTNGAGAVVEDDKTTGTDYDGLFADGASPEWKASGALAGPDNALDFDGVNDHVEVVNGSAAIAGQAAFSISGWVYPRTADAVDPDSEGYFGVRNNATADFYLLQVGTNIQGRFQNSSGSAFNVFTPVLASAWQHLALIYDGAALSIYQNGVMVESTPASGTITDGTLPFLIGAGYKTGGVASLFLDGMVDEVQIWSAALSEQQVRENMAQTISHTSANLQAYYRFDQYAAADQTILYDLTANNRDGALTDMDTTTDWVASTAFNTWIGADSTDWSATGNWSRYAAPAGGDSAGVYAASLANNPTLGAAASMNNLVVAAGAALTVNTAGSLNVSDWLYNYGTISQSQTVNAAAATFAGTGSYGGVILDPGADDLGTVTVTIDGYQPCNVGDETIHRCFNVTSTNAPTNATLTFFFDEGELNGNTCSSLELYHATAVWTQVPLDATYGVNGRDCVSAPRSLRATGITSFSPFAAKTGAAPTAIELQNFSGTSAGDGLLLISLLLLAGAGAGLAWAARRRMTA
ncbi:MAG: LamG domain-containing protein [Chloroflexi bacterium]|nr:LamG domain-containing protein [Chloroflexota bacterium]